MQFHMTKQLCQVKNCILRGQYINIIEIIMRWTIQHIISRSIENELYEKNCISLTKMSMTVSTGRCV